MVNMNCLQCDKEIWIVIPSRFGLCGLCYSKYHPEKFKIISKWCDNCERGHSISELCPKVVREIEI